MNDKKQQVLENIIFNLKSVTYDSNDFEYMKKREAVLGFYCIKPLSVNKDDAETTLNVFVKRSPNNNFLKSFYPFRSIYQREMFVYNSVLPLLKITNEKYLAEDIWDSYLEYIGGSFECFERLAFKNELYKHTPYIAIDPAKALSFDQLVAVLKEYARLHALGYATKHYATIHYDTVAENMHDAFFNCIQKTKMLGTEIYLKRAFETLDKTTRYDQELYQRFEDFSHYMFEMVKCESRSSNFYENGTFIHGDAQISNYLFSYGECSQVGVASQQQAETRGNPMSSPVPYGSRWKVGGKIFPFEVLDNLTSVISENNIAVNQENTKSYTNTNTSEDNSTLETPMMSADIKKVCLLDWQLSRIGSPAMDFSSLIWTSTDSDTRRRYYGLLKSEYHNMLKDYLRRMRIDVNHYFPFQKFTEDLEKYSFYGLYMAIMTLYHKTANDKDVPNFNTAETELELLEMYKFTNTRGIYHKRMGDVLRDFFSGQFKTQLSLKEWQVHGRPDLFTH